MYFLCVNVYCHRVTTQLQLINISYHGRTGRPARPRTQHGYHHDTKVKPEATTAVIELLMMDGKTPETCWAVNKRQDNKLKNCCIWLVIYSNYTMMHGLNKPWIQALKILWASRAKIFIHIRGRMCKIWAEFHLTKCSQIWAHQRCGWLYQTSDLMRT